MKNKIIYSPVLLLFLSFLFVTTSFCQSDDTIILKKKSYYDSKYGDTAYTILVPGGWNFEGNIVIGPAPVLAINSTYEIKNHEGSAGVTMAAIGQRYVWATPSAGMTGQLLNSRQGQDYYGSVIQPTMTPRDYYYQFLHQNNVNTFHNYVIKEITPNQEMSQVVYERALRDPELGGLVSYGLAQIEYDVIEIKSEFTVAGKPIEGYSILIMEYVLNQNGLLNWGLSQGLSIYAQKDRLEQNKALYLAIMNSFSWNIKWFVKVQKHRAQFKNIVLDVQEYTRKMNQAMWENRNAVEDICINNFSDAIRGTSDYRDPFYDEPKRLPNSYDYIWMNSNGDVLLTDKVFNPNENSQLNQHEWRKTKK